MPRQQGQLVISAASVKMRQAASPRAMSLAGLVLMGLMSAVNSVDTRPQVNSFWNTNLRPENIVTVPYGNAQITVWKHVDQSVKQFYAMPEAFLIRESAVTTTNKFTGSNHMYFKVQMWSEFK